MTTASRLTAFIIAVFALISIPKLANASPVCYQAVNPTHPTLGDALALAPTSCSTTPTGYGWYREYDAAYELHIAIPYSWNFTGCDVLLYWG
jgi:hypothetical protein